MKQESMRKLRHRILAGMLCFSIIFAAQPNGLNASGFLEEENADGTVMYEDYNGTESNPVTEETRDMNPEDIPAVEIADDQIEEVGDTSEDESINSTIEDSGSDTSTEETLYESADNSALNNIMDEEDSRISDTEETEAESLLEDSTVPEPQTAEVHQHSMSVDCSISSGEQVTFNALTKDFTGGELAPGNYYLSEDITLDSAMEINSGTVNLCLNGHTMQYGGATKSCVIHSFDNLYICDCRAAGMITGGTQSGIVGNNVTMYGGSVSGNTAISGGGISGRNITMYGGNVSSNTAENGGGIYCHNGTFIMQGGSISHNTVAINRFASPHGGGVSTYSANFLMYGGMISHNRALSYTEGNQTSLGCGGGIHIGWQSALELWGGTIQYNEAAQGGGVHNENSFIMHDGIINSNTGPAGNKGGGVMSSSEFEMKGGTISGNAANYGGGIYAREFKMSGGSISDNTAQVEGGGICGGGSFHVSLSGKPIIRNNTVKGDKQNNLVFINISPASNAIIINGPFVEGANVGVTKNHGNIITTEPFAVPATGADYLDISSYTQYFSSDITDYGVLYQESATGVKEGLYLGDGITITYDYTRNGGNSVTLASAFVEKNTTLDLSPDASNTVTAGKDGWEFLGWNTDPDATDVLDTLAVKEENITLYAIYKKTLTASFYSGNGNQKLEKTITIYNNKTEGIVTAPALEALPGWTALGWDRNRNRYEGKIRALSDIRLTEDCDFYGIYQQPITISYDANGGAAAPAGETKDRYANVHNTITYQNPVVTLAPAVSRTGYTFDGWHQGSSTGMVKRPGTEVELTGTTTFYADWKADTDRSYVVEHYWQDVLGDGYTLIDTIPCTGTVDTEAEAEARAYTGLTENAGHPSRKASGIIAADGSLVLKLYYDRDTYTVSFDLNGGEGTAPEAQIIRYGGNVEPVPAPTRDGYAFTGWYTEQETGNGIQWNFAATVEDNERNRSIDSYTAGIGRSIQNTDVILYAGWEKNAVNMEPANPGTDTPTDSSSTQTVINNTVNINNSNTASGKPVPGTGDTAPIELYATAAMIAGLSYLLLELADERGMTEEKKRELTARLVQWARKGGSCRKVLAVIAMFLLLAYYHGIGKQISAKSIHVKRLSDSESV